MKYLVLLPLLLCCLLLGAQNKRSGLVGKYRDYFGNSIEIGDDSTFNYSWRFDLMSSWSKGRWSIKRDTLYLRTIPIYDTLSYMTKDGKIADSLILSDYDHPKRISTFNFSGMLSSGGQNRQQCPDKLFYKDEKLFGITKEGKLIKAKIRGFWTEEKWDPWYFKQIEK